ncbi:hypothetical protein CAEBREN_25693 [Caenorhabditis brenneri]|uniref:Uncharacterized protein n=1 Tax=Caenorhabditis brenneri TaxID=135651 RepID=G0MC68_CAEBE|nr:hypothetical protein CAEBREN_25693 [Caenorhabditis brenneri]
MSTETAEKPEKAPEIGKEAPQKPETTETKANGVKIEKKLEEMSIKAEKSVDPGGSSQNIAENGEAPKKTKLTEEEAIEKIEKQIDEYVKLFEDPAPTFEEKMQQLVRIPKEVEHCLLIRERADRLFKSIPIELFRRIFEQPNEEYLSARPILIHILGFIVQITSAPVHRKFKPLLPLVVDSVSPRGNRMPLSSTIYTDTALMVGMWADETGDGKYIYDTLRHMTSYCAAQKNNLDVGEFLLCIRTLIHKIYQVAAMEDGRFFRIFKNISMSFSAFFEGFFTFSDQFPSSCTTSFDSRGWTVGILAVIRRLLQERQNRFTPDLRRIMWEVISCMTRVGGIGWFNLDKTFAKLAIQMNHVELQMTLQDIDHLDVGQFCLHLRILELYTNAICDSEMFGEEGQEIIPRTVGDSTRFILSFWVEAHVQKIKLPTQLSLSIFHFAIFLFVHEELTLNEDKTRKHFGACILETAFNVLEEAAESDLRGEVGTLFTDMLERLSEFEVLVDTVPVFIMKYLDKIRIAETYEDWKNRVIDCKCCIMDLRGRVDWYSIKTLNEAKEIRDVKGKFTDPELHELSHLFAIFDKLPRVN